MGGSLAVFRPTGQNGRAWERMPAPSAIRKTYKYQLRPTPAHAQALEVVWWRCRTRSNAAREHRGALVPSTRRHAQDRDAFSSGGWRGRRVLLRGGADAPASPDSPDGPRDGHRRGAERVAGDGGGSGRGPSAPRPTGGAATAAGAAPCRAAPEGEPPPQEGGAMARQGAATGHAPARRPPAHNPTHAAPTRRHPRPR